METEVSFIERQYFRQAWLLTLIFIIAGFFIFAFFKQIILGVPVGNKPASDTELTVITICVLVFISLLLSMRLETKMDVNDITVRFFPFLKKSYRWIELSKVYVRKYQPLGEFGGWGMRGLGKNRAWNISGNMGIQLEFKDGRKMLSGTKKPEEARIILEKFR